MAHQLTTINSSDDEIPMLFPDSHRHPITEDYELGQELGIGKFSVVQMATHRKTRKKFAVKHIDRTVCPSELLVKEVKIMQKLHGCPGIIHLVDVYENPTLPKTHLVLELVTGGELFDYIVKSTNYSEKSAADYIRQLCQTVEYLHSKNVVHRDLKPENLLFEDSSAQVLKLCDFGLADTLSDEFDFLTLAVGTKSYMAPEVTSNMGYSKPVDMYSVGVILYILLCGYLPLDPENGIHVLEFPPGEWSEISYSVKLLIKNLLDESPAARPTASQVLKHPWVRGTNTSTKPLIGTLRNLQSWASSGGRNDGGSTKKRGDIINLFANPPVPTNTTTATNTAGTEPVPKPKTKKPRPAAQSPSTSSTSSKSSSKKIQLSNQNGTSNEATSSPKKMSLSSPKNETPSKSGKPKRTVKPTSKEEPIPITSPNQNETSSTSPEKTLNGSSKTDSAVKKSSKNRSSAKSNDSQKKESSPTPSKEPTKSETASKEPKTKPKPTKSPNPFGSETPEKRGAENLPWPPPGFGFDFDESNDVPVPEPQLNSTPLKKSKETKEPKETKENKETKEGKETKEKKETKELSERTKTFLAMQDQRAKTSAEIKKQRHKSTGSALSRPRSKDQVKEDSAQPKLKKKAEPKQPVDVMSPKSDQPTKKKRKTEPIVPDIIIEVKKKKKPAGRDRSSTIAVLEASGEDLKSSKPKKKRVPETRERSTTAGTAEDFQARKHKSSAPGSGLSSSGMPSPVAGVGYYPQRSTPSSTGKSQKRSSVAITTQSAGPKSKSASRDRRSVQVKKLDLTSSSSSESDFSPPSPRAVIAKLKSSSSESEISSSGSSPRNVPPPKRPLKITKISSSSSTRSSSISE